MIVRGNSRGAATRSSIIGAARTIFRQTGVNGSGLHEVACAAGVTRGAVYWHFENKLDLFEAMLKEVRVPLINCIVGEGSDRIHDDPLTRLADSLCAIFRRLERDAAARETLEIILLRCEFVGEFAEFQEAVVSGQRTHTDYFERLYAEASREGLVRKGLAPLPLAIDTFHFVSSLVKGWLSGGQQRFDAAVKDAIETHVALRRPAD